MKKLSSQRNAPVVGVIDLETDPFLFGREPLPFVAGIYLEGVFNYFWGVDCIERMAHFIESLASDDREYLFYWHNGGKFDAFYFLKKGFIKQETLIINGRIVECYLEGVENVTFRDSYAILPFPLALYKKDIFDYNNMEVEHREKYRDDILKYLKNDCIYLYELVSEFVERFGPRLTIGGTAMKELRNLHPFKNSNKFHDARFRPFYHGGRVQVFKGGIHKGKFKIFDVNSMYPYVMATHQHPTGKKYLFTKNLEHAEKHPFYFIHFTGTNKNAIPQKIKKLDFTVSHGEFKTTSHELRVGLQYGLIEIDEIHSIMIPEETINFNDYVQKYIKDKIAAKKAGDKKSEIFAKLLLNSAYGKFGQNPQNYFDWAFRYPGQIIDDEYRLYLDSAEVELWRKPVIRESYYDVATAASVTSAARAVLLAAMQHADNLLYCDTDSLICEKLDNVPFDSSALGAWSLDAECNRVAVAGKKMYAAFAGSECVKMASKGVHLDPSEIVALCKGKSITSRRDAPTFNAVGNAAFIERTVRANY